MTMADEDNTSVAEIPERERHEMSIKIKHEMQRREQK